MLANITQAGLELLAYLHDHAGGSGERISLDPKLIIHGLHVSPAQFAEDSASLAGHGLAGVRDFRPNANGAPGSRRSAIWLTGKGEHYLRRLEAAPGVRRRVTVAVVEEMGGALTSVAAKMLRDFAAVPH